MLASTPQAKRASLLLLEHVNLNVTDPDLARAFYSDVLGATFNPVSSNERQIHFNVGMSQFHLPFVRSVKNREPVLMEHAQRWVGKIHLQSLESSADICTRLSSHSQLSKLQLLVEEDEKSSPISNNNMVQLRTPWDAADALPTIIVHTKCQPDEIRAVAGRGHAGGFGKLVAMPRVVHSVFPGNAAALVAFFRDVLECEASLVEQQDGGSANGLVTAIVPFSSTGQTLEFMEVQDCPATITTAYNDNERAKYHLALYMESQDAFSVAFSNAQAADKVWRNPRFEGGPPEFGSATELGEAIDCGQFRVKDLGGGTNGAPIGLVLELEIRSPTHKCNPLIVNN